MNTTVATSSTVKLNLPVSILRNTQAESERIGISVQDFIRMLLASYFAHTPSLKASSSDETRYHQALREVAEKVYTVVSDEKGVTEHLSKIK